MSKKRAVRTWWVIRRPECRGMTSGVPQYLSHYCYGVTWTFERKKAIRFWRRPPSFFVEKVWGFCGAKVFRITQRGWVRS